MNSPRIRHLVQPSTVAERNVTLTNGVSTVALTPDISLDTTQQRGVDLLISHLGMGLLRWSQRRAARHTMSHVEMALLRRVQADSVRARDLSRLSRLG